MEIKINHKQGKSPKINVQKDETKVSYSYYDYIDILMGDPISSLLLTNKYVIIGTMLGKIILFTFAQKDDKFFTLSKSDTENISGLSYIEEKRNLYASIGDEKILKYQLKEPLNKLEINTCDTFEIYEKNITHKMECENAYILMAKNKLLKINIFIPGEGEEIKEEYIKYEVLRFTENNEEIGRNKGKISSTNFYVPLDFDGMQFCWVEYLNDKKDRNLCVQFILKDDIINKVEYVFKVDKKYGHISHAKLMNNNTIFIVHELNKCEIRNFTKNFELIESFTHLGDEVYAVDILYNIYNDEINFIKNNRYINKKVYESYAANNDNIYKSFNDEKFSIYKNFHKTKSNRNKKLLMNFSNELKTDTFNLLKNSSKIKKIDCNETFTIITLDIDGNINKYENKIEEKLFNLYDIDGIHQDHKDKKFFNMGYVYYIKTDLNFFCITTDHGCYIIKRDAH